MTKQEKKKIGKLFENDEKADIANLADIIEKIFAEAEKLDGRSISWV